MKVRARGAPREPAPVPAGHQRHRFGISPHRTNAVKSTQTLLRRWFGCRGCSRPRSSNDRLDDVSMDIGQPVIPSAVPISQTRMIEPKEMKHGRMQVMDVHAAVDDRVAVIVGFAVSKPAFYPAPSEPAGERLRVMLPALRILPGIK